VGRLRKSKTELLPWALELAGKSASASRTPSSLVKVMSRLILISKITFFNPIWSRHELKNDNSQKKRMLRAVIWKKSPTFAVAEVLKTIKTYIYGSSQVS
jgi:hypothetical protein